MSISRYEIFMMLLETKSFTKAAQELDYSQSAVSQSLQSLEKDLGVKLLIRNREGVYLSEDGKTYLPYIRNIAIAEQNLKKKKNELLGLFDGKIRIGTFTSISRNILPELMSSFKKIYPDTSFELRQGEYNNIHEWLLEDSIDFGFVPYGLFDDLHYDLLYQDYMVGVLPVSHPLAAKKNVSLKDFVGEPFILLDEGEYSVPMKAFEKKALKPDVIYKVYDDYSILAMVREGLGISILYRLVVKGFEDGIVLKTIHEPVKREVSLAYKNEETMSFAASTFYAYVRKEANDLVNRINM